jgi:hypothetical protein
MAARVLWRTDRVLTRADARNPRGIYLSNDETGQRVDDDSFSIFELDTSYREI